MEQIQFEARQASLSDRCNAKIARMTRWLNENPAIDVRLVGSVDRATREDAQLAAQRVEAVRDAMIAAGIHTSRIQVADVTDRSVPCGGLSAQDCEVLQRRVEVSMARRY
jgi:outer membrane protein OmpA-like peptidoglycan-associated protein